MHSSIRVVRSLALVFVAVVVACSEEGGGSGPDVILQKISGDSQTVALQDTSEALVVRVADEADAPVAGVVVAFELFQGGGTVLLQDTTDTLGAASARLIANTVAGARKLRASVGAAQVVFDLTVPAGPPTGFIRTSPHPIETGTAGTAVITGVIRDTFGNGVPGVRVDWEASDGTLSQAADTSVPGGGVTVTLTAPGAPGSITVTGTVAAGPVQAWTVDVVMSLLPIASVSQPSNYGIHDQFVRDGLVFASVWNTGLRIYDVGNGIAGGSPAAPALVSTIVTPSSGVGCNCVHNAWWFHNPTLGQQRYVFVGQEGPGTVGTRSSGLIHVVDVTSLAAPVSVGSFTLGTVNGEETGVHNFWMDEPNGILYAAYYNGGVVSIDVSDTLVGDISGRLIERFSPDADSYVWGVQQVGTRIYASDMINGLWSLATTAGGDISAGAGLGAVSERFTSDLWIRDSAAYSGTWGSRGGVLGNVTKVWSIGPTGALTLRDSLKIGSITTVSDNEVSPGGELLLATAEGGGGGGLYLYDLADPFHPKLVARGLVGGGLHTGTFAEIGGRLYVFASKNPAGPALVVFDVTDALP